MTVALSRVLNSFGVPTEFWSRLLGYSDRLVNDWMAGRRELPFSVAVTLSKAIGIPAKLLLGDEKGVEPDKLLPPLWLKARQSGLGEREYSAIALARILAANYDELLSLGDASAVVGYRVLFNEIRERVDPQKPAQQQGADGATHFLEFSGLGKGALGIGEVIRGFLRARDILLLETPIDNHRLEGFCVPVGTGGTVRPCIVANSYRTTWFRRNYIILHELAHAVFDLEAANAVFDVSSEGPAGNKDIAEERADSFALNALLPKRLLVAYQNRGYQFDRMTRVELARLVAETHAEQGLLVRALVVHGLVSAADAKRLTELDIASSLREVSFHARGLSEIPRELLREPEVLSWGNRLTSFPASKLRLPIPFVRLVLEVLSQGQISRGRAAELLMITDEQLETRFHVRAREDEEELVAS